MIMMMKWLCIPTDLPSTNKQVSTNQRANESYPRGVSSEASKLNHAVINKKKQGHQMQFSLEKRLEKRK